MNLTRLEQAFVVLGRCNILAVHDCECCSTCAHARLSGELMARPELKGYVYYHGQDCDGVLDTGELYIRYASRGDTLSDTAEVAQVAVDVLRGCDLQVEWDGDASRCIRVLIPPQDMAFFHSLRPEEEEEEEEEEDDEQEGQEGEEPASGEDEEQGFLAARIGGRSTSVGVQPLLRAWRKRQDSRATSVPLPFASEAYELA